MKNYQKLKQIIQEANPEIMELKFGCEVEISRGDVIDKGFIVDFDNDEFRLSGVMGVFIKEEIKKILGRPIRLADVLLAIEKSKKDIIFAGGIFGLVIRGNTDYDDEIEINWSCAEWNLLDDNLDHQLDETKKFLIELLVK